MRVWGEVRSEAEIELNYQNKFDSGSLPSGLIANWQMDGFDGSNQVVDVVSGNNLSIGHATGVGFIASTPAEDLHVSENAGTGATVGYVVPTDPDVSNDIVFDGSFLEDTSSTLVISPNTFGGWTVTEGSVDVSTYWEPGPLGGVGIDLNGFGNAGTIEQTLNTEVGRVYQVVFALSGNWDGGDLVKEMRASAGGESVDFSIEQPSDWSNSNMLWANRSFTFTADANTTDLRFASLNLASSWGPAITDVRVIEIPQAVNTILNSDPTLSYDAATGKFYKVTGTTEQFADAQTTQEHLAERGGGSAGDDRLGL